MAHSITFTYNYQNDILTESEIKDLIEMLYRWEDTRFNIIFEKKHKRWRGSAQWKLMERTHHVTLYVETIRGDAKLGIPVGGSQSAPEKSARAAMAMVIAHELQHCNQVKLHKQDANSTFYGGHQYWNLASEREARAFVDDRLNEICAYFGMPPVMRRAANKAGGTDTKELKAVIKLLLECDGVTSEDINDELRASNLMSPANFSAVKEGLRKKGVEINRKQKLYFSK